MKTNKINEYKLNEPCSSKFEKTKPWKLKSKKTKELINNTTKKIILKSKYLS